MRPKIPVVRTNSWRLAIPQFIVLGLCLIVSYLLVGSASLSEAVIIGSLVYLTYSFGSRRLIIRHHFSGQQLIKAGNYTNAIPEFEKSYAFLSRFPWVDQFRSIILMSASFVPIREMDLVNIAFCYSQLGDRVNTKAYYEQALVEFPDSEIASTALNLIKTAENDT